MTTTNTPRAGESAEQTVARQDRAHSKKPHAGRIRAIPMTQRQIEALTSPSVRVEMFVSSHLGPEVSCETEHERDAELKTVVAAIADLEDRQ